MVLDRFKFTLNGVSSTSKLILLIAALFGVGLVVLVHKADEIDRDRQRQVGTIKICSSSFLIEFSKRSK